MTFATDAFGTMRRRRGVRCVGVIVLVVAAYKSWLYLLGMAAMGLSLAGVDRQVIVMGVTVAALVLPLGLGLIVALRNLAEGAVWAAFGRALHPSLWIKPDTASTVVVLLIASIALPAVELSRARPAGTVVALVLGVLQLWLSVAVLASGSQIERWASSTRRDLVPVITGGAPSPDPIRKGIARFFAWLIDTGTLSTTGLLTELGVLFAFLNADPKSPWRWTPFMPFVTALAIAGFVSIARRFAHGNTSSSG